jgi:hypothetical protein
VNGLVIDIVLVFFYKAIGRLYRLINSIRWHRQSASVLQVDVMDPFLGCPSVGVRYQFNVNEMKHNGYGEMPFLFRASAKRYAKKLSNGSVVTIRVNPHSQRDTLFFNCDQLG